MNAHFRGPESPERVISALSYLSSEDEREWSDMGKCVHSEWPDATGFDIWHDWSAQARSYESEADCRSRWNTFKPGKGLGLGTLFKRAREAGWADRGDYERPTPLTAEQLAERAAQAAREAAELEKKRDAAAILAKELLDAGSKDIADHPYAQHKFVGDGPHNLRFGGGVRRGPFPQHGIEDALLVPIYVVAEGQSKLVSVEAIPPAIGAKKVGLKDGRKAGGIYPLERFRAALNRMGGVHAALLD